MNVKIAYTRDTSLDARASAVEGVMKVNIGSKQGLEVLAETLDVSLDGFEVQSLKVNMNFGYGVFLFSHLVFFSSLFCEEQERIITCLIHNTMASSSKAR